jgi:hypothetical protein
MITEGIKKEANVRYWSGTDVIDLVLFNIRMATLDGTAP